MMNALPHTESTAKQKWASLVWPLIGFVAAANLFAVLLAQPAWRFGDGSEYYALYLAILEHGRPFMTEDAWSDYSALAGNGTILYMADTNALRASFPSLADAQTADFNHFWFYPALAAAIAAPLKLIGLSVAPHKAFLALHALLFGATLTLAGRLDGKRGATTVAMLFLASPVLWFATRAHTEFFTVALILQTFILLRHGKLFYAAIPIAFASTQNISLAATAWALITFALFDSRMACGRRIRVREIVAAGIALVSTLLHPLYYLHRHGVITPQLKVGGAKVGGNLEYLLSVLIEPDIGLFPNWCFGVFIFVVCIALAARYRPKLGFAYPAIVAIFLITNLFAQASTTNLNSGSIDLSRYALWYIPLFYAPLFWLISETIGKPIRWPVTFLLTTAATPLIAWNLTWYWPSRPDRYTQPTIYSWILQAKLPDAYDPPAEVFTERNTGTDAVAPPEAAVAGPACRKLYVPAGVIGASSIRVISRHHCVFDEHRLAALVAAHLTKHPLDSGAKGLYITLDKSDVRSLQLRFVARQLGFAAGDKGISTLAAGWSVPESWGTWSDSVSPKIEINLGDCGSDVLHATMSTRGFATQKNPRVVATVLANGRKIGAYDFTYGDSDSKQLKFDIACADLRRSENALTLDFDIDGAARPSATGLSADGRLLGIGVEWIDIQRRAAVTR